MSPDLSPLPIGNGSRRRSSPRTATEHAWITAEVTFITAIPRGEDAAFDAAARDDWDPGETVTTSVEVLTLIGQWAANAAIVLGIIVAPIGAVLGALGLGALGVHRTVIRRIRGRME